jgi:DNA invertase Pin-like site-specific DNA recombinase
MATYYPEDQQNQIRNWLLELRGLLNPVGFSDNRDRAHELVRLLEQIRPEPTSIIATEIDRLRRIWRRLADQGTDSGRR